METLSLQAVTSPGGGTVTWSSSDAKGLYVTVDENGVLTLSDGVLNETTVLKKAVTVKITATATDGSGKKGVATITIQP